MYSHVTVGTNDFAKAEKFYGAIMAVLGHHLLFKLDGTACYGELTGPKLFIVPPYDGKTASAGNGVTVAFKVSTRAVVDEFHRVALENGGVDEGAPGLRAHYHPSYYGGYVRDPDGNKIHAVCHRKTG